MKYFLTPYSIPIKVKVLSYIKECKIMRTLSRVFEVTSRGKRKSEKSRLDYAKETTLFFPSPPLLMARIAFYGKSLATEYPEQLSQSNILP